MNQISELWFLVNRIGPTLFPVPPPPQTPPLARVPRGRGGRQEGRLLGLHLGLLVLDGGPKVRGAMSMKNKLWLRHYRQGGLVLNWFGLFKEQSCIVNECIKCGNLVSYFKRKNQMDSDRDKPNSEASQWKLQITTDLWHVRAIDQLKSSDRMTVLGSRPSGDRDLHSEPPIF